MICSNWCSTLPESIKSTLLAWCQQFFLWNCCDPSAKAQWLLANSTTERDLVPSDLGPSDSDHNGSNYSDYNPKPLLPKFLLRQSPRNHVAAYIGAYDVILQNPSKVCQAEMKSDDIYYPLLRDCGGSIMCISGNKSEFPTGIQTIHEGKVQGIANSLKIADFWEAWWFILVSNGYILSPYYYQSTCILYSQSKATPAHNIYFWKAHPDNPISISSKSWTIKGNNLVCKHSGIDIFINLLGRSEMMIYRETIEAVVIQI